MKNVDRKQRKGRMKGASSAEGTPATGGRVRITEIGGVEGRDEPKTHRAVVMANAQILNMYVHEANKF